MEDSHVSQIVCQTADSCWRELEEEEEEEEGEEMR